jgi:hypothetical protein
MSTEITNPPVLYEPSLGEDRQYIDKVPSPIVLSKGVKCGCSARQTVFTTRASLLLHFKTATHQTWLENQNKNRENHYTEVLQLRELVKQQTLLIAEREQTIIRLEKQLRNKDEVIRTLSTMLSSQPPVDQNKISSLNATSSVMLLDIDM